VPDKTKAQHQLQLGSSLSRITHFLPLMDAAIYVITGYMTGYMTGWPLFAAQQAWGYFQILG
jgi:hypothetical protein